MADELKTLQREARKLQKRMSEIGHERSHAETALLVGRFFKLRNCYSCPEKPSDYWWVFLKVTGHDGSQISGFEFQRDKYGRSQTEQFTRFGHGSNMADATEISAAEYERAWASFFDKLVKDAAK